MRIKKDRLGSGPTDGEEVLEHRFITSSGIDKKELLEKKIVDEYFAGMGEEASSSLKAATVDEPLTLLFPGMSKADLEKKLASEFGF